jgi:uncharacterized protein (DUF4415 family)
MYIQKGNPEWTSEDFKRSTPRAKLPKHIHKAFRGPQKIPTKQLICIRLWPEVLKHCRAFGRGWQSRIDEDLQAMAAGKRKRAG